ncbi:hypothetical protein WA026_022315 [Henosepilachna vigintioctopunctata]|uniref:Secreted protein n=1 Tax=Henosepilachna vigintioctopunctata TaxID=420089 RepID=A0AAW1V3S5_9CUCU
MKLILAHTVVIFVESVQRCIVLDRLLLTEQNFPSIVIHEIMSQEERLSHQQLLGFQKRILVAICLVGQSHTVVIFVESVQRCIVLDWLLLTEQNFPAIGIHEIMSQEEILSHQQLRDF